MSPCIPLLTDVVDFHLGFRRAESEISVSQVSPFPGKFPHFFGIRFRIHISAEYYIVFTPFEVPVYEADLLLTHFGGLDFEMGADESYDFPGREFNVCNEHTSLLAFSVIRKQHSFAAKYGIAAEYANSIIPSGIIDGFSVQAEHPAVVRQFIDELDPVLVRGPGAVCVPVALLERNYVRCFGSYIFSNLLHCGKLSEPEIVAHYFKGVVFLPCECGNCGRNGNKCGKKYLFHIYITSIFQLICGNTAD